LHEVASQKDKSVNARERFIDYVKNGSDRPLVSLQIGAGAGFDVKLAGKTWNSYGTLDDLIRAYEIVECEPLFNTGLPGLTDLNPDIRSVEATLAENEEERIWTSRIETPFGPLDWRFHEVPKTGTMILEYPVTDEDGLKAFDKVLWYAEQHAKGADRIPELLGENLAKLQPHGAVSVQWNLQPFEMFGLPAVNSLVMLAMLHPERFKEVCEELVELNTDIMKAVFKAGADFVFLGGPGVEMLNPRMYEDFLIPDSRILTDRAHDMGGLIYSHICSPIEPFLTMGFYNRMGIDLFETLSPPPVGNVESLAKAREICDDHMCTRGNIGLDLLLKGTPEDVEQATLDVLDATKGSKHMVAASDYLFYDIPLVNVKTVVETVNGYA